MSTKPQDLNKIIDDLRQIIVGEVTLPTDQIEQITLFLFLKQLSKKHDDLIRLGSKKLIFKGQYERYHFNILIRHSGEKLVKECKEAIESLYKNTNLEETLRRVFERSYLKILEPRVLKQFLDYLDRSFPEFTDLGDFYECLLDILGTQKKLGQVRTPRHIIDFIIKVVDPNIGDRICDPADGTAGFLLLSIMHLIRKYTDKTGRLVLNPEQRKKLYSDTIFGWDKDPLMVKYSISNLYLHDLKNPHVYQNDTLLNENLWQHTFDVIVTNPPFITPKGGAKRHSRFAIKSNKTEVLFLEWMVHHLNFNGRMGVIVPEGVISTQSNGHKDIRKLLLENGLWCVVSLPAQVFQPYAGVKTSIVLLDKTFKPDNILFCEIANHGFSLNTNPAPIDQNDLPEALEIITKYRHALQKNKQVKIDKNKYYTVEKKRILADPIYNLTSGVYREKKNVGNHKYQIVELGTVADVISGQSPEGKFYNEKEEGIPFYQGKTEFGEVFLGEPKVWTTQITRVAEKGDILMSVRAPVGPINIATQKICIGRGLASIRASKRIKVIYLFIYLRNIESQIKGSGGAVFDSINRGQLQKIKIPLPPLEIQEQIVTEIESYQRVIDGTRQIVENWEPTFKAKPNWQIVKLDDVCKINPSRPKDFKRPLDKSTTFIPMSAVAPKTGKIANPQIQPYSKVQKGYTYFEEGDVLFAKITPCMQNGKNAIARNLIDGIGFGSTEFHVFRPKKDILAEWIWYSIRKKSFLEEASGHFTGAVGQQRVPESFMASHTIPLPPLEVQKQIVAQIEEEQKVVEANQKLMELYQAKIKSKLAEVWRE